MTSTSVSVAAVAAAPLSAASGSMTKAGAIARAAHHLLLHLERGQRIDAPMLRTAMESAFGASDADGAWDWKTAYDACEAATVLFLRKFGPAMRAACRFARRDAADAGKDRRPSSHPHAPFGRERGASAVLARRSRLASRRAPRPRSRRPIVVLEPSAGTGLLAILAELAGASLVLNELAETRAGLLSLLFPGIAVTRFDAAHIDDHLDAGITPSVVLMNPPFSAVANVDRRMADAALRHIASALARLAEGGRLVAITGASCSPDNPVWRDAFVRLQERGRVVFSAAIDGAVFAKHGTTIETRLTVIDRLPADDPTTFPSLLGVAPDVATLLGWVTEYVPARLPIATAVAASPIARPAIPRAVRAYAMRPSGIAAPTADPAAVELAYETVDWTAGRGRPDHRGALRRIRTSIDPYSRLSATSDQAGAIGGDGVGRAAESRPIGRTFRPTSSPTVCCPTRSSRASSMPARRIPSSSRDPGRSTRPYDVVCAARDDADNAVRFRRGWFLGDGTGAGKGRQVAGILLDNWLKGRRRAVWISKSDKLIEDAQRDWSALGMERLLVTPLSRFRQGTPIRLEQGVLFTTYATLRSDAREEKVSRVKQIVEWLGADFDGVIIFDESHAMQNAAGGKGERGDQAPRSRAARGFACSMPCRTRASSMSRRPAPPRFTISPMPSASACGAARTSRSPRAASSSRRSRRAASRRWRCWRAISRRSVSTRRGRCPTKASSTSWSSTSSLTEQIRIYDAYAGAFAIIHNNLDAAMRAANITGATGTLNAQAKSAARSAFESREAALLQSSHHGDEDAVADRVDRARSRGTAMPPSSRSSRPARR